MPIPGSKLAAAYAEIGSKRCRHPGSDCGFVVARRHAPEDVSTSGGNHGDVLSSGWGAGCLPRPADAGGLPRPADAGGLPRPADAGGLPRPADAGCLPRPADAGGLPRPADAGGASGDRAPHRDGLASTCTGGPRRSGTDAGHGRRSRRRHSDDRSRLRGLFEATLDVHRSIERRPRPRAAVLSSAGSLLRSPDVSLTDEPPIEGGEHAGRAGGARRPQALAVRSRVGSRTEPFDESDRVLLEALASVAAVALSNADLHAAKSSGKRTTSR